MKGKVWIERVRGEMIFLDFQDYFLTESGKSLCLTKKELSERIHEDGGWMCRGSVISIFPELIRMKSGEIRLLDISIKPPKQRYRYKRK